MPPEPRSQPAALRQPYSRASLLILASVLAGFAIVACHEYPTGPRPELGVDPSARFMFIGKDTMFYKKDSPDGWTWSPGPMSLWDGGIASDTTRGVRIWFPTLVVVTVSGDIRRTSGAITYSGTERWGPTGTVGTQSRSGAIGFLPGPWVPPLDTATRTKVDSVVFSGGLLVPFREGVEGAQPDLGPNTANCGMSNGATPRLACYNYVGTSALSFTRPRVGLTLTRSPDAAVTMGTSVTFTAGKDITSIGRFAVPLSDTTWMWFSDTDHNDNITCNSRSGLTCAKTMTSAGTMILIAYVNGERQIKSSYVPLTITPSPVIAKCDTVPETAPYPYLRDSVINVAMRKMWDETNYHPGVPDSLQRESGGWIVQDPVTRKYSFQRFVGRPTSCSISVELPAPANTVATIHTHEWALGDKMTGCGPTLFFMGVPGYTKYDGTPSGDDGDLLASKQLGNLQGFIIDVSGFNAYKYDPNYLPDPLENPGERMRRCGY